MPRCTEPSCGRWRPERLAPRWAAGVRLNGDWYCSRPCVERAAHAGLETSSAPAASISGRPPLRLGVLLRHMQAITEEQLNAALAAQRASGRRLGAELVRMGYATREQVVRALAEQAGVRYLTAFDASRAADGPSWFSADMVRALGLVPFDVDAVGRRVRVLCSAPVPRTAVGALLRLTGWIPDVYLADDDVWKSAMSHYRPAPAAGAAAGGVMAAGSIGDAAAFVADAALADRIVTMRHASCDRYTWVRVEGPARVADLILPETHSGGSGGTLVLDWGRRGDRVPGSSFGSHGNTAAIGASREDTCRVASTAH